MSTVPIICVADVEKTSELLQKLFGWKSDHGGPEFDNLIDKDGRSTVWLHHFDAHEHARFFGAEKKERGVGLSIYARMEGLDGCYKRCKDANVEFIEEMFFNENAQFREFTIKIADGYQFTAFEKGPYFSF